MSLVTVVSPKGGVGKTTLALNLAYAFAASGRKTLLVDTDPQGGVGNSLQGRAKQSAGLYQRIFDEEREVLIHTRQPNLTLLPVGQISWSTICEYEARLAKPETLQNALNPFAEEFELVILDTPAGMGSVTFGALRYAQHALMPVQTEPLALRAVDQLLEVLAHLRSEGPCATLTGVILSMANLRDESSLAVAQETWSLFPPDVMLEAIVPHDDTLVSASAHGVPAALLRRRPPPIAAVFDRLAAELEPKLNLEGHEDDQPIALLD